MVHSDKLFPLLDGSASIQAQELQKAMKSATAQRDASPIKARSIAVVSGKGGVGKSNVALNLALLLGERFKTPTILLDADINMANLDVLLGLNVRLNLGHVLRGELSLKEVMLPISERVWLLPGGNGISKFKEVDWSSKNGLLKELSLLDEKADAVVIDTGAGVNRDVLFFAMASDAIVIVTTPEPTALKDAYGLLKSFLLSYGREALSKKNLFFIINMAQNLLEANTAAERLIKVSERFLALSPNYLGYLPFDPKVAKAVKERCPVVRAYPKCSVVKAMEIFTSNLIAKVGLEGAGEDDSEEFVASGAFQRLLRRLRRG